MHSGSMPQYFGLWLTLLGVDLKLGLKGYKTKHCKMFYTITLEGRGPLRKNYAPPLLNRVKVKFTCSWHPPPRSLHQTSPPAPYFPQILLHPHFHQEPHLVTYSSLLNTSLRYCSIHTSIRIQEPHLTYSSLLNTSLRYCSIQTSIMNLT